MGDGGCSLERGLLVSPRWCIISLVASPPCSGGTPCMSAGRRRGDMLITTAFDMLIIARAPNLAAGKRGAGRWWLVAGGWWLVAGGWWLVGRVGHFGAPREERGAANYYSWSAPRRRISSCTGKQFVAPGQCGFVASISPVICVSRTNNRGGQTNNPKVKIRLFVFAKHWRNRKRW